MVDIKTESEYIGSSKIMTIDDAVKKIGVKGEKADKFKTEVSEKQDNLFTDIMSVVFGWKIQPNGDKKLVSKLPNGKIIFPDRSEQSESVQPGIPYICLVYERDREAFAKICSEEYQPKIFIHGTRMITMVWRDDSGNIRRVVPHENSYEDRLVSAIKQMEKLKFPSVRIVFRVNQ